MVAEAGVKFEAKLKTRHKRAISIKNGRLKYSGPARSTTLSNILTEASRSSEPNHARAELMEEFVDQLLGRYLSANLIYKNTAGMHIC